MEVLFKDSSTWQQVMTSYVALATEITDYCKDLFSTWEEKAHSTSLLLQQPIFGPALFSELIVCDNGPIGGKG